MKEWILPDFLQRIDTFLDLRRLLSALAAFGGMRDLEERIIGSLTALLTPDVTQQMLEKLGKADVCEVAQEEGSDAFLQMVQLGFVKSCVRQQIFHSSAISVIAKFQIASHWANVLTTKDLKSLFPDLDNPVCFFFEPSFRVIGSAVSDGYLKV